MKSKSPFQQKNHKSAGILQSSTVSDVNQSKTGCAPAANTVATRAYFIYLNQGSLPGHDLHYWLEAKAQLPAERHRFLIHGFAIRDQLTLESPGKQSATRVQQNGGGKGRHDYEQQLH
jgi:hypothetical protein